MVKFVFIGCIIGLTSCFSSGDSKQSTRPPNIVFILIDDMGVPTLGCYGSGYYQTPHIDQLAREGVLFTDAYSSAAICSPTRASILTGKHPARLHITDFIPGTDLDTTLLEVPDWQKFLPLEEQTIGEVFKANGYQTALIGKWHLSKEKTPPVSLEHGPEKQGFMESFMTYKPSRGLPLGDWQQPEKDAHNVDTITSLAIDFMEREKDRPFFLMISHNSIHDPIMEREATIQKYRNEQADDDRHHPVLAAMIERVDQSIGRLMTKLKTLELLENTIVVFYSDNGTKEGVATSTPLRAGKGWLYEGGIRVPLIISWKGRIAPGGTTSVPVTSMDFLPTLTHMAGITLEKNAHPDGVDLTPTLFEGRELDRTALFWHYPHYHVGSGMLPASAIRSGDYKLIRWYEKDLLNQEGAYELYHLGDDPGEQNDLFLKRPDIATDLQGQLNEWLKATGAQVNTVRGRK